MRDNVLWRKESHIILMLAETLQIDAERALDFFYTSETYKQLTDSKSGLQLMSDQYIVDNIIQELQN